MSDAAGITGVALSNVQAPMGIKMLKKAMDIQESATLQLLQSVVQNTRAIQAQGIGRFVNAIA